MSWRRPARIVGGLVAVALGAVALAAGAGIAVPHLTRGGMSATTAWGTVALLAGLALLAVGTHTLAVRLRSLSMPSSRWPAALAAMPPTLVPILT